MGTTIPASMYTFTGSVFPICSFEETSLADANHWLEEWGHKMGPLHRGDKRGWSHLLKHDGYPVAVLTASYLISPVVGNAHWLTRENTVELSRLCASRPGLCRVAIRLWREFVLPDLPFQFAVSYQDADLHNGHTYRTDGWERVARSRSGIDTRSGRVGRDKWVWQYPRRSKTEQAAFVSAAETLP